MSDGPRVALVVPCYNEARRLDRDAFAEALAASPWLDLIFVNDGSTDGTVGLLHALRDQWPTRVEVLSLERNAGKAEAVRQGLMRALAHEGVCGFWDADLSAPLDEVPGLRTVLAEHPQVEWAWGIRLRALGREVTRRPVRHYLGRLFATVSSLLLAIDSYDTQCGAKLFRVSPLLRAVLAEPFRSRWIFDVELLSRADALLRCGGTRTLSQVVYEQPLAVWRHQPGSKLRSGDFVKALRELLVVRSARRRWYRAGVP